MKIDQLSWEDFYNKSKKRLSIPNKINDFNRLIAHTKIFLSFLAMVHLRLVILLLLPKILSHLLA